MKQVAVVGLGNMGFGMAKNLLAAGFPVTGYDLRPERGAMLADIGGRSAESLAELADADAVFVMVMSGAQALDVVTELRETLRAGATIIVTATVEPAEARGLADVIEGTGLQLIDSPVSGGQFGAEAGTLTMMVAATPATFADNRDVLKRGWRAYFPRWRGDRHGADGQKPPCKR